jgi:PKD repeat protein
MKRFFFTTVLMITGMMLLGQTNYTVSVTGTIEDQNTGDPVPGQTVYISTDSIVGDFFYYNQVITNDNGFFTDSFDVPAGLSGETYVSTMGCQGIMLMETVQFSENSNAFTFSFLSCNDPSGGGDDCEAMFNYTYESNTMYAVQFTDLSLGYPNSWDWDFGDGVGSDEQNPIHTYQEEGDYNVSLTISSDSLDCTSTLEMLVRVGDTNWFPDSCMAMFYSYPNQMDYMTINFVDASIGNNGDMPDNWFWEFGDGTTSTEQNPSHTYSGEGTYQVCLTISDNDSTCENTWCDVVEVIDWNNQCQAQFDYFPAPDSFPAGNDLAVQFIDYSLGNPSEWNWNFGDDSASTEQNPIHIFNEEGTYNVCLTISNSADSCESTFCRDVYVYNDTINDCYAWFNYDVTELTVNFQGFLNNSMSGVYSWEFGDGTGGVGQTISHEYSSEGYYEVTMTVADSASGCYTAYTEMIILGNVPMNISGYVLLDSSLFADQAFVYLMTFDTTGNGVVNIAETEISDNGYYEFEVEDQDHCVFYVQAELEESSGYYGEYLPTYHYSALNWLDAAPIFRYLFYNDYTANILMIPAQPNAAGGEGIIAGIVSNNDGRSMIENVEILLYNDNDTPLIYDKTNLDGVFDFTELPYGTYKVYTEMVGIQTTPAYITLNQDNPTANISIVVHDGEALLGIDEPHSAYIETVGSVYPNPTTGSVSLNITMIQDAAISIEVINNYGQQIMEKEISLKSGENQINLASDILPKGLYFISIRSDDGIAFVKKLIRY